MNWSQYRPGDGPSLRLPLSLSLCLFVPLFLSLSLYHSLSFSLIYISAQTLIFSQSLLHHRHMDFSTWCRMTFMEAGRQWRAIAVDYMLIPVRTDLRASWTLWVTLYFWFYGVLHTCLKPGTYNFNCSLKKKKHRQEVDYSLSLICQPDIRGHEAPQHHQKVDIIFLSY